MAKAPATTTQVPAQKIPRKGTKARERYDRRMAKIAEKEAKAAAKLAEKKAAEEAVAACRQAIARMPPGFGAWGVVRTRAYRAVLDRVKRFTKQQKPALASMSRELGLLKNVADGKATLGTMQKLATGEE